ncbi:MAG: GxxExxY protein [Candidatus Sungbacteria bacterium]|nr:GxxExxY protein [Candidatus Sungbacteria bacterium]
MPTDSTQINTDHRFPEKELCHKIIGCLFAAHNKYGSGHREIIYDRAFQEELEQAKISFIAKPKITLHSVTNGKRIGFFVPDYLINDKVLVELKALPPHKMIEAGRQLLEYLKISKYELGYAVNFAEKTLKPCRYIHTNDRKQFICDL